MENFPSEASFMKTAMEPSFKAAGFTERSWFSVEIIHRWVPFMPKQARFLSPRTNILPSIPCNGKSSTIKSTLEDHNRSPEELSRDNFESTETETVHNWSSANTERNFTFLS